MEQDRNYKVVQKSLVIGIVLLSCVSIFVKDKDARRILIGIDGGLFFAMLIQFILFKIKPSSFANKNSSNPDEES